MLKKTFVLDATVVSHFVCQSWRLNFGHFFCWLPFSSVERMSLLQFKVSLFFEQKSCDYAYVWVELHKLALSIRLPAVAKKKVIFSSKRSKATKSKMDGWTMQPIRGEQLAWWVCGPWEAMHLQVGKPCLFSEDRRELNSHTCEMACIWQPRQLAICTQQQVSACNASMSCQNRSCYSNPNSMIGIAADKYVFARV